jgi:ElaB/YqjD/DUF883 family membrane-anchored ribosome-binding protein
MRREWVTGSAGDRVTTDRLMAVKARVADLQQVALAKTRVVGRATADYAHANPWQVMAIGAVAGLVLGFVLTRGGDSHP